MTLTERALQTLLNHIQGRADTLIQASPTIYDNCPGFQTYHFGVPDLQRATQMPILAVDLDTEQITQATLGTPTLARKKRTIPALLHIFHAHRDPQQLTRQLIQLVDLTIQTLETYPQSNQFLYQQPRLVDFTPPIARQSQHTPWLAAATISTTILITHPSATP